jgi:hypothetical protein
MARYGQAFRSGIVARLLPPESAEVGAVAKEIGVSVQPLERWREDAQSMPARGRAGTAGARLEAVITAAALDEAGKSAWCREHGVYPAEFERSAYESFPKRLRSRLDIKNLRLHDMRRHGVTRYGMLLGNPHQLKQVSGPRTLQMVTRYLNISTQDTLGALDDGMAGDALFTSLKSRPRKVVRPMAPCMVREDGPAQPAESNVIPFPRAKSPK